MTTTVALGARVRGARVVEFPLNTTTAREIGQRLKTLREALGITQYAVASALSIEVDAYRHYEAGRRRFTAERLPDIAAALGVSTSVLARQLFGDGEPTDGDTGASLYVAVREALGDDAGAADVAAWVAELSKEDAETRRDLIRWMRAYRDSRAS